MYGVHEQNITKPQIQNNHVCLEDKLEAGLDPLEDKMYLEVDPLHFQPQCNLTIIGIIDAKRTFL